MKRGLFITALVLVIGALGYNFYYKNLRGVGPAVNPPASDIPNATGTSTLPLMVPKGYKISLYAKNLGGPRVMAFDPVGNIIVSVPSEGKVVALKDGNRDNFAEENVTVISGLNHPHGLAFRCPGEWTGSSEGVAECTLFIAETNAVSEYTYNSANLKATKIRKLVDLPDDGGHSTRTLMFMPVPDENTLLISVGSSCNVCVESDSRRASILAYDIVTKKVTTFAKGLRNSVFMNIHPVSGDIWATDMGRDLLGDNLPPDEVNILGCCPSGQNSVVPNFGWPICYGKNIHDDEFDHNTYIRNPCMEPFETPSYIDVPAHSAPLGLTFIPEEGWPTEYWYNMLVAYHGSWNRSVPTGYKIVRYKLNVKGEVTGPPEDFITGWLKDAKNANEALGRPVDLIALPGGTVYITDDKAGVVYRMQRSN